MSGECDFYGHKRLGNTACVYCGHDPRFEPTDRMSNHCGPYEQPEHFADTREAS